MSDALKLTCLSCGQANGFPVAKVNDAPKCAKCGALLVSGTVGALDIAGHDKAVRIDDLPLIVDYWAPWCGPCKTMAPQYATAAKALRGKARFASIDTEKYHAISQQLQIRGIPLLILYAEGKEVARLSGARPAADIDAFVRQHI